MHLCIVVIMDKIEPIIKTISPKKLVGNRIKTTRLGEGTKELWQNFMPRRNAIQYRTDNVYYSIQAYEKDADLNSFTNETVFERWAAVEVTSFEHIPEEMEKYTMDGGEYAVFKHKGPASSFYNTLMYIFGEWLPNSKYALDNRVHFELLQEDYSPIDPNAEEDVYIPIKSK